MPVADKEMKTDRYTITPTDIWGTPVSDILADILGVFFHIHTKHKPMYLTLVMCTFMCIYSFTLCLDQGLLLLSYQVCYLVTSSAL